ncbi:MAG: DUF1614 domain-containing protein [Methylococcaceae bacterium]|jgi:uncharacterized membrane protein
MPFKKLMIVFFLAVFLLVFLQIHLFEIAFAKLGLTPEFSLFLLLASLLGSGVNLPIFSMPAKATGHLVIQAGGRPVWQIYQPARAGKIVIAVNLGGCVLPVAMSLYFISLGLLDPFNIVVILLAITAVSFQFSRLMPGLGVGMPLFLAPVVSAVLAVLLEPAHAAQLAYVGGVLGVLLGADLLKLKQVTNLGAPVASIGGAGTFDGIFLTGIIAALLA